MHPDQQPGHTHQKPGISAHPDQFASCLGVQAQSPGSVCTDQQPGCPWATTPEALGNEHLPPSSCTQSPTGPTHSLGGRQNAHQRGAAGIGETAVPRKTSLSRGLNYTAGASQSPQHLGQQKARRWELPLIGAPQGQHNWWTKGIGRSRMTLRNWTGGWTTVKSVAQEGRKVKPIPPLTTSCFTDRKTSRTDLTCLKPVEDIFFSFFPLHLSPSCFLSYFLFFIHSSFLPLLFYSFFLRSIIYFFILSFVKIPSSFLSSNLFLFLLLSYLPFLFYSFFLPTHLLFLFFPPFPTGETIKYGALKRP